MTAATPSAPLPLPRWAARLGYAGALPFVALAAATWLAPTAYRGHAASALLAYGATIASFMGAIHWGLAMRAEAADSRAQLQLGLSVIPPLLGWLALSSGLMVGLVLPIFLLAFVGLYLADLHAVRVGLAPRWYHPTSCGR